MTAVFIESRLAGEPRCSADMSWALPVPSRMVLACLALVNGASALLYASVYLAIRGTWLNDLTVLGRSPRDWREEQFILIGAALLGALLTPELAARLRRVDDWPSKAAVVAAARQGVWRGYMVVFGSCALVPVFMALQGNGLVLRFPFTGGLALLVLVYAVLGGLLWAVMTTPIVLLGGSANGLLTAFVVLSAAGHHTTPDQQQRGGNVAAAEQTAVLPESPSE